MQCPKCLGEMEKLSPDSQLSMLIERCTRCFGLYFDQLTKPDLELLRKHRDIDMGDPELGSEYDDMVYVECPKCDRIMNRQRIEEPVKIRFEQCEDCRAVLLDAGEFRRYADDLHARHFAAMLPDQ